MKKSYDRILQISDDHKQITLPDSRFYRRNGDYYPSITHVLSYYPKGPHFEDWLKKVGYASEYIVKKAAEEGTQTHNLCEDYLNGKECSFLNQYGNPAYPPHVWSMFLNFVDFWETHKPTLIETEVHLFSDTLRVAGTCDLIIELNGELWLKSKSRGEDKAGKRLKGKNWEIVESERSQEQNLSIFNNVKALFDLENPAPKPHILTLKTTVKREI